MKLAKDIMTKKVITVAPDTKVEEIAEILSKNNISGVPVVNENNEVVGIVSEGDLIYKDKKLHMPSFVQILGGIIFLESMKAFEKELKKIIGYKAEDIMEKHVITVTEDTPIDEIATIMIEKRINRVPVVRKSKLVGIVTRADIVKTLVK